MADQENNTLPNQPAERPPGNQLAIIRLENQQLVAIGNPVQEQPQLKFFFYNISDRNVDVIWIDQHLNKSSRYAQLCRRGGRVSIATYENHRWIFRDSQDGELFISFLRNSREGTVVTNGAAFIARPPTGGVLSVQVVYIASRVNPVVRTLKCTSIRSICSLIDVERIESIVDFGFPTFLEVELAEYLLRCIHYQAKYDEKVFKVREKVPSKIEWSAMNPVEIRESLLEKGSIKIDSLLQGIRKGRHFDVLLLAVMDVCRQKKDFRLQKVVLEALAKEHFPKLGALSAYEFAVKLLDMIKKRHSSSTTVLLLQQLVFSAQLMSASKLRSFIKLDLVELHTQLFAEDCETSALLSTIVFYALLMEVSYSPSKLDESQLGEVKAVWDKVLSVNNSEDSAILQLSSFMLYTTLGEDAARFAKNISRRDLFKDVQKRSSMSCVDEWRINTAYDYLLLSFLMTNLSTVALTFPKKKLSQLLDFMICTCSKYQLIKALASEIPQLIDLRYSGRIDRFEQMFFNALESHPEVDVQLFMGPTTLFESRRNKPLDDIPLEPPRKKKKKHDAYELSTWEDFLSATNGTPDELGKLLLKTSSAQLNLLVADLVACSEFSNGELHGLINDHIPEFLHLLNFFLCNRKGFTIEFHTKIAELMTAEEGLKKNSLRLAASLLGCCRCEQVPMLISLCISFLVPIATKHVQEWDSTPSSSSLVGVHDFVLAKLEFLTAIFKHFPKVAQAQAYLLASILPDFFLQLSIYKKESLHFEAEQLEQKLSTIGREIKKQKASFHKFIPFVLSRSLTGEREINFPTYWLLSACDDHDLAVLATNFPPQEKKKYANVQQQFYAMNKIIG